MLNVLMPSVRGKTPTFAPMKINGQHYTSIWDEGEKKPRVFIIDQRYLPHRFQIEELSNLANCIRAIRDMHLRGAPLIGAAAAYGMYLASRQAPQKDWQKYMQTAAKKLLNTRPTAVDLAKAIHAQLQILQNTPNRNLLPELLLAKAREITATSKEQCKRIGQHGATIIKQIYQNHPQKTIHILTHCNAGWLACVDYGTALAPIYTAFDQGINLHVWVDETRPRNQGARLTAFELAQHGIPHTIIADNTGGHLMQHNMVDLVIVGSDRTTRTGDVANKIGTYLKALAAHDNNIPFYVALPTSTIDFDLTNGINQIPIEKRNEEEIHYIFGLNEKSGKIERLRITPPNSPAANFAFDVTPARLITGLITEHGILQANEQSLSRIKPNQ